MKNLQKTPLLLLSLNTANKTMLHYSKKVAVKNGEILLRNYSPEKDYPQVKRNLVECGLFASPWDSEESLLLMSQQDTNLILIAEDQTGIVGSLYITTAGYWAHIWRVAVRTDSRQRGIGKNLILAAEEFLHRKSVPWAGLFVDTTKNSLEDFYKKLGWQRGKSYNIWNKKI